MGSKAVALPPHKTLIENMQGVAPNLTILVQAAGGRKPRFRAPAPVLAAMKSFPRCLAWIEKNRVAYERFIAAENNETSSESTTKTRSKAKGAAG